MPALAFESNGWTVATSTAQKKPISNRLMIGVVAAVVLVIAVIGFSALSKTRSNTPPVDNPATAGAAVENSVTKAPVESPTSSELGIGSTMTGKDDMILMYVPAGEFTMGSDNGEEDEKSVHTVYLDAFWIDQTEVTNKMYAACVAADACAPPASSSSQTQDSYYGNAQFDNYPVIYVTWDDAKAFCAWAGRRLPTEAEWEKAARGTDERAYPWGNSIKSSLANYYNKVGDTTAAGSYEDGKSPYGALDMAGNVLEWVSDWYDESYYESSLASNPLGPARGNLRVLRGGAWNKSDYSIRSALRSMQDPTNSDNSIGFRCALSIP
jgi:serine/threonine-protein kinase